MSSPERLQASNRDLTKVVTRELEAFWSSLDLRKPEAVRDALVAFVTDLTRRYGDVSATVAADWYAEHRAEAGVVGRFDPILAPVVAPDRVESRVRFGAGHLFTDAPAGTLAFLLGVVSKYTLQPGRDTIATSSLRDPAASGWKRIVRPGGCDFCRMLAGRGAVYKESTSHFASHGDCNCAAVPSFDQHAPEVDVRAYVASQRTSAMSPDQREAHTARVRAYLADFSAH